MRYTESRFLRRLGERREARQAAEDRLAARMARQDPRSHEDRRRVERRGPELAGDDLARKLAEIGREDQRRATRRKGDDRRRR